MRVFSPLAIMTLFFAVAMSGQQKIISPAHNKESPVFALLEDEKTHSVIIDPMLLLDGKILRPLPDPCNESGALRNFNAQYLAVGATYDLIFGGVRQGIIVVKGLDGEDWQAVPHTSISLAGLTMALAVSPSISRKTGNIRRDPTPTERNHAKRVGESILRSKGVPANLVDRMQIDQIAVTAISGVPKVFVALEIEREDKLGMEYSVSFIADLDTDSNSIIWFQHALSETDAEAVYLVDQLDINGDGADEIFTRRVFYENYQYEVFAYRSSGWDKEFATQVLGCE